MYETNIWLDEQDKSTLMKKALKKQLSLSTFCDIIVKHFYIIAHENIYTNYIHKGTEQTHIKLKNKNKTKLTPMIVTNCLYLYLHGKETNNNYLQNQPKAYERLTRLVQSESDRTYDSKYMGNTMIRTYYNMKGNK